MVFPSAHSSPLFAIRISLSVKLSEMTFDLPHFPRRGVTNFDRFHEPSTTDDSRDSGSSPQTEFLSWYSHHQVDNAEVIDNGARPEIADGALCLAVYRISGWRTTTSAGCFREKRRDTRGPGSTAAKRSTFASCRSSSPNISGLCNC